MFEAVIMWQADKPSPKPVSKVFLKLFFLIISCKYTPSENLTADDFMSFGKSTLVFM